MKGKKSDAQIIRERMEQQERESLERVRNSLNNLSKSFFQALDEVMEDLGTKEDGSKK
jgi:hypothetical protein